MAAAVPLVGLLTYFRVYLPAIAIGEIKFPHLVGISGASIIAIVVPAYSILKRRRPEAVASLLKLHIFGNLAGFLLITAHFGYRLSATDADNELRNTWAGLPLYVTGVLLVATGIFRRFQVVPNGLKVWSSLHINLMILFFLIAVVHALRALKII